MRAQNMNATELLNQTFGRHLVPQTGDSVADAQAALSSGHAMAKGGTKQRIASGWAIIKPSGATMQFKLAAKGIGYSDKTRYDAFAELFDTWDGTPAILMEFDKKPVPVENLFITYDLRAVRVCSPKGVETFDYTVEPEKDGCKTHKVLYKQRKKGAAK
jgi:hypothetical protein